ncbi:30S ribosomal protein S19 [Frankliniella fusca]|uniref:30S ribosomal protein S19 n=1 Tax=Frankliniella fusca TaxID=407009 RepID=A0AAE1GYL7_9NEOP|nr:30S ribosomal protein S19 [Frankliniella fusca]
MPFVRLKLCKMKCGSTSVYSQDNPKVIHWASQFIDKSTQISNSLVSRVFSAIKSQSTNVSDKFGQFSFLCEVLSDINTSVHTGKTNV